MIGESFVSYFSKNHQKISRSEFEMSNDVVVQLVASVLFQRNPPNKNWLIERLLLLEIKLACNKASL